MSHKKRHLLWPLGLALLFFCFLGFSGWSIYHAGTRVSPVVDGYGSETARSRSVNKPQ